MGSCPADAQSGAGGAPGERANRLDLSAFPPAVTARPARWLHAIRRLDPQSRLRLHELADLAGFDGSNLMAVLRRDLWELRIDPRAGRTCTVDCQHRVSVPLGICHQLGLHGPVLVSLAADRSRIAISSSSRLDALLEVGS